MTAQLSIGEKMVEKSCCVIMPTYNNAPKLRAVLKELESYKAHLIIVNDGCTDETESILKEFDPKYLLVHEQNKGKGVALQNAFRKAIDLGFSYAITIDSDGQHLPSDIPKFLDCIDEDTPTLSIGARNMDAEGVPGKSSFGNKFSNFWYWAETGIKLTDTQSGFRLYPLDAMKNMKFFTNKFEFEIEIIVRLAWKGCHVTSVPISVLYEDDRISHFRPFKDFFRISVLNTVLFTLAILAMHPYMYYRKIKKKGLKKYIAESTVQSKDSNLKLAISAGFGVFMGIVPIWGYQLGSAIGLAYLFKLNKPIVILTANISIPPFTIIIIYLSYLVGAIFYGGQVMIEYSEISLDTVKQDAVQYLIGASVLSVFAGLLVSLISFAFLKKIRKDPK
jgi:glycosyltransferase involved in cell wall biosynthesis